MGSWSSAVERRPDGVVVMRLGSAGLAYTDVRLFDALLAQLDELGGDALAVVLTGGSADFLAGTPPDGIEQSTTAAAEGLARHAQEAVDRIASHATPIVAAVTGACSGCGLELALACRARVAADDASFANADVRLGLGPAGGATWRLPELVGLRGAIDLLVDGRCWDAMTARRAGLVEAVVPASLAVDAAAALALRGPRPVERRRWRSLESLGRRLEIEAARRRLRNTGAVAPRRIVDGLAASISRGQAATCTAEARIFGELAGGAEARELAHVHRAIAELCPVGGAPPSGPIAVTGSTELAGQVAIASVRAGMTVRFAAPDANALAAAYRRARSAARAEPAMVSRIGGERRWQGFAGCRVVLDAGAEEGAGGRLAEAERACAPGALLVTTAVGTPVKELALGLRQPERLVGMCYAPDLGDVPLVEIVPGERTSAESIATASVLGGQQGRAVLVTAPGAGACTTRLLATLIGEAVHLLFEGAAIGAIDAALASFGFRVGPLWLADAFGIDRLDAMTAGLGSRFGERLRPPPGLEDMLAERRLGRAAGRGFYRHDQNLPDQELYEVLGIGRGHGPGTDEIVWRCVSRVVNEAGRCHADGLVRSCRDADAAAVLALGFPARRGGPLRYCDAVGAATVLERLERYAERLGARFSPAPALEALARAGRRWYEPVAAVMAPRRRRTVQRTTRATVRP